jgi:hypothetical protein
MRRPHSDSLNRGTCVARPLQFNGVAVRGSSISVISRALTVEQPAENWPSWLPAKRGTAVRTPVEGWFWQVTEIQTFGEVSRHLNEGGSTSMSEQIDWRVNEKA